MTSSLLLRRSFVRCLNLPALGYGALVLALLVTAFVNVINEVQHHRAFVESAELLAGFERHRASSSADERAMASNEPKGSPFLQGPTQTVASAALLQRVTSAITGVGGSVVSSQVEPQDAHATNGFIRITATCELEQKTMQHLLYDIEAGMPFLFVDKFDAQSTQSISEDGRIRVVVEVSGLWPGAGRK